MEEVIALCLDLKDAQIKTYLREKAAGDDFPRAIADLNFLERDPSTPEAIKRVSEIFKSEALGIDDTILEEQDEIFLKFLKDEIAHCENNMNAVFERNKGIINIALARKITLPPGIKILLSIFFSKRLFEEVAKLKYNRQGKNYN